MSYCFIVCYYLAACVLCKMFLTLGKYVSNLLCAKSLKQIRLNYVVISQYSQKDSGLIIGNWTDSTTALY